MKHKALWDATTVEGSLMKKHGNVMSHFVKKKRTKNNLNNPFKREDD
jgi:hypothetical protein